MSLRIDSTEWISGALIIGDTGFGVLGSEIPSTGDSGAGYAYNDLSLPADAGKEICGRITAWPSAGTLTAYEDTSFTFTGAPDGSYWFAYQLYVDGVATGSPVTVSLNVGATSATATGAISALSLVFPTGTATGTSAGDAVAFGLFQALGLSSPLGVAYGSSVSDGVGVGTLRAIGLSYPRGSATGTGDIVFSRAPAGNGYTRVLVNTTRPSQENTTRIH